MIGRWMIGARRLVTAAGLGTAVLVIGASVAGAQESEPEPIGAISVSHCSLGVTISGGVSEELTGFPIGEPIDLELSVVSDGPVFTYFVLAAPDGGEDVRLNDGQAPTLTWTPVAAGSHTIYGEFEDAATGELVEVATPESCTVTLGVVDGSVVDPPPDPEAPCADTDEPDDLTLVPIGDGMFEAYDDEGNLCATIAGETVTQPGPSDLAELPATGASTAPLTALGITLVTIGWLMRRRAKAMLSLR